MGAIEYNTVSTILIHALGFLAVYFHYPSLWVPSIDEFDEKHIDFFCIRARFLVCPLLFFIWVSIISEYNCKSRWSGKFHVRRNAKHTSKCRMRR